MVLMVNHWSTTDAWSDRGNRNINLFLSQVKWLTHGLKEAFCKVINAESDENRNTKFQIPNTMFSRQTFILLEYLAIFGRVIKFQCFLLDCSPLMKNAINLSYPCYTHCRTHNLPVCLYIANIACGSASLYIKTLYFYFCTLALSAAATVANIKIRYDAKTPQFAIFGTRVICVFYSIIFYFNCTTFIYCQ